MCNHAQNYLQVQPQLIYYLSKAEHMWSSSGETLIDCPGLTSRPIHKLNRRLSFDCPERSRATSATVSNRRPRAEARYLHHAPCPRMEKEQQQQQHAPHLFHLHALRAPQQPHGAPPASTSSGARSLAHRRCARRSDGSE
jgi:hypothetical protein